MIGIVYHSEGHDVNFDLFRLSLGKMKHLIPNIYTDRALLEQMVSNIGTVVRAVVKDVSERDNSIDWLLYLDVHEYLEDSVSPEYLIKLISQKDVDAYSFPVYYMWSPTTWRADGKWKEFSTVALRRVVSNQKSTLPVSKRICNISYWSLESIQTEFNKKAEDYTGKSPLKNITIVNSPQHPFFADCNVETRPFSNDTSISLVTCVRNEETNVKYIMGHYRMLFDDIIFIDNGSTDKTAGVATKYGAKVLEAKGIVDDFSKLRNIGLTEVKTRWVFQLDADERLEDPHSIIRLLDDPYVDGMITTIKTNDQPSHAIRLFRNDEHIKYVGRVHEEVSGIKFARLAPNIVIAHSKGYDEAKETTYWRLLVKEIEADPSNLKAWFHIAKTFQIAGMLKESAIILEKVLQKMPNHVPARMLLADTFTLHAQELMGHAQSSTSPQYFLPQSLLRSDIPHVLNLFSKIS